MKFLRYTLGPIFLISLCPSLVILFWYTATSLDGSILLLTKIMSKHGVFSTVYQIWKPIFFGSPTAWIAIFSFAIFQLLLMRYVPGKTTNGPTTPKGFIPTYKDNGFACYLITLFTFITLSFGFGLFSPSILFDHLGEILGALLLISFIVVSLLYVKGRFYPNSADRAVTGNVIFDFFWGIELYPNIFGFDVKHFTNCRFGMMSWPIMIISFAAAQSNIFGLSNSMIVSVALQLIYITKFFYWEAGYLRSLDIMHDRAGFYICWGVLVWVPAFYTSPTLYLVLHPLQLSPLLALSIFSLGTIAIVANYLADRQRVVFRESNGEIVIWGKRANFTKASFVTEKGEGRENLLLASGFWGISRHFHYIPEILGAFFWSLPALFTHMYPFAYVIFLAVLLIDRAHRDDIRCGKKYGDDWKEHCRKVPYKIIPYIY